MTFDFHWVRFEFRAAGKLYFPPHKAGNIVRGAFGSLFRKTACNPECRDATHCEARASCPYARIFEPQAARGEVPSGLADWPRPFVFRASHLDGCSIGEGDSFHFDVHLFDVKDPALEHFASAFSEVAREGLGPGRGRAELVAVDRSFISIDLAEEDGPVDRVRVRFVTPTELKGGAEIADTPEFAILFARLRDRISTLRALYGAGPLDIDFRAMGERAGAVEITHCALKRAEVERLSSRTGQRHSLGGFVGEVEYAGALSEFLPYLRLGKWVGVGRQTVWGKGEFEILGVNEGSRS